MKRSSLLILSVFLFIMGASFSVQGTHPTLGPAFKWAAIEFDFGEIQKDEPVYHTFTFTNHGDDVLYITKIKTSCGCTAAEYSTDGVAPGEEGFVKVRYNASKVGTFRKTVSVEANTGEIPVLSIKGSVAI